MGACGRGGGRVWGHVAGVEVCSRDQAYGMDRDMLQGWGHVVGCGSMYQGVEACGRGGGRVWGHVAGCGGMWYGVRPMAWTEACGRGGDMW